MTLDIDTFDCSDVGPNVVTLTVTDIYGNTSQCSATVTVEDNTAPVIACIGEPATLTGTTSDSPGLAIPDGDPAGISTTMTVTDDFDITDLDVHLDISHTWVGDLIVTIASPAGTSVTIVDRMGVPDSTFGCAEDDLQVTLDDEASDPIEDECSGSPITGSFIPNNALSAFDGENTLGDWILTVSDNATPDPGVINSWGITYSYDVSGSPLVVELDANGMATLDASDLLLNVDEVVGLQPLVEEVEDPVMLAFIPIEGPLMLILQEAL
jgi:subtilisin-like proprotein convertase family protein